MTAVDPDVPLGPAEPAAPREPAASLPAPAARVPPADAPARPAFPVPFFSQARSFAALRDTIDHHVTGVLDHGKFSHGVKVEELERELARWTGAPHVVGVASGTDALVLLLRAAGLRSGEEVVVPAFSFAASATAVVLAGGRPVFADIDPVTYALDPDAAAAAATSRCRFLMPAHLFCRLADMPRLHQVARRRGLEVLEDSAEAIGMRLGGVHAGLLGRGGVLSFFPSKTLGAIGDAGAVLTADADLAAAVRALRHHGRPGRTTADFHAINTGSALVGTNSKMDDLQAAVLLAKLTRLDADIARRRELAAAYGERLAGVPGVLRLPGAPHPADGQAPPVPYVYVVEVERRDALAAHLARHGIGTETYYPLPLPFQPCFAGHGHRPGDFPHAEAACTRTLALPLYPDLTLEAVDVVCDRVRAFCTGSPR